MNVTDRVSDNCMLPWNFRGPIFTPRRSAAQKTPESRPASGALKRTRSATLASETYSNVPSMRTPPAVGVTRSRSWLPAARSLPALASTSAWPRTLRNKRARFKFARLHSGNGTARSAHSGYRCMTTAIASGRLSTATSRAARAAASNDALAPAAASGASISCARLVSRYLRRAARSRTAASDISVHAHDDLAAGAPGPQVFHGRWQLGQRIPPVDDRSQFSLAGEPRQICQVGVIQPGDEKPYLLVDELRHHGALDRPLQRADPGTTLGTPNDHDDAGRSQHLPQVQQRMISDIVENQVESLVTQREVLLRVVDDFVGAK